MLTYAIVTPARNERDNLARLAESIIGQDHRPERWVIVDDGSDDGMDAVAERLARRHDWIVVVGTGENAAELAEGRRRGRDLLAFRRGLHALPGPVDVFVKVDADTSFEPDYFERLLAALRRAAATWASPAAAATSSKTDAGSGSRSRARIPAARRAPTAGRCSTLSRPSSRSWAGTASTR